MKITIIGTGNAACANAFKLSELGHNVALLKTSIGINDDNFDAIIKNKGIWAIDHTNDMKESFQAIAIVTRDPQLALKDAEVVIVQTQSLFHENVAKYICPFITSNVKLLMIVPGALGSLLFKKECCHHDLIIAEGESTPFDARIKSPGVVEILFSNIRNSIGVLPAKKKTEALNIMKDVYPTYCATRANIVESALHNPNLIVHTIGVIMSASRIEYSKGDFWMYKEGFTPSIWKLISQLDKEKCMVMQAYGGIGQSYLDAALWRNSEDLTIDPMLSFTNYANNGSPKGPNTINTRYLTEDIPNGLVLMESLANVKNIEVPITRALIDLACIMLNQDFRKKGRTLVSMGFVNGECPSLD